MCLYMCQNIILQLIPGTRCDVGVGSMMAKKARRSMSLQCEDDNLCHAPLKRQKPCPPLLQGLHTCDSDNKRSATLEDCDGQMCCVHNTDIDGIARGNRVHITSLRWVFTTCRLPDRRWPLPNAQLPLARNIG